MSEIIFKVWISIERIDDDAGVYEDVDMPWSIGEFETLEDAERCVNGVIDGSL